MVYQAHFHHVSAIFDVSPTGKFHRDDGTWATPSVTQIPVNGVFLSTVPTDPNILLGYGTWELIAQNKYLKGSTS